MLKRRTALAAPLWWSPLASAASAEEAVRALQAGGAVAAFRHALAPGTFDPPQFKLGDCSTQRNLSDDGRAQARQLGQWFATQRLRAARVRSSPWCRCLETARLAFGDTEVWPALGSPRGHTESVGAAHQRELRLALQAAAGRRGSFEVWVTHLFVLSALAQGSLASGEGLVLGADAGGAPRVLARILPG